MEDKFPHRLRIDTSKNSFNSRISLLKQGLVTPNTLSAEFINACANQTKFANLCMPEAGITLLSLNTLSKYANELFINEAQERKGTKYLDWLRNEVYHRNMERISNRSRSSTDNRRKNYIEDIQKKLDSTEAASLLRSKAYLDLIQQISSLTIDSNIDSRIIQKRIHNILVAHSSKYSSLFTETSVVKSSSNVEILHK